MNIDELGKILRQMYDDAPEGEKETMIHLFGLKYSDMLDRVPIAKVVEKSGIPASFSTEIRKMIKLSGYVTLK